MQETRENIKTRMLKNAAKMWGYTDILENQFDPLVSLLLTACATELEKISGEIHASRARILERLIQLLTPEALTGALPAHTICTALSIDHCTEVNDDTQLYTRIKVPATNDYEKDVLKDIFFSPTDTFQINKATIRYMAAGNTLYKINNYIEKEVVEISVNSLPESTLWIAIDEPTTNLQNSLFYFDLRNERNKNLFFYNLPKAEWHYHTYKLTHLPGYGDREICEENFNVEATLSNKSCLLNKLKKRTNALYKQAFINLTDKEKHNLDSENLKVPQMIAEVFTQKVKDYLRSLPLRWIRIRFPETITNHLLQDAVCIMNCFPVINRRIHEMRFQLKELSNIIPLSTEDTFLDLEEVYDDENKPVSTGSESAITMQLRKGGVGRFDERNAAELIDSLIDLLRDESAAFSMMGNDFMNSEAQQLQQIMYKLEQKLTAQQVPNDPVSYLVFHKHQKQPLKNIFIKYCSTNGQLANNLKPGSTLQVYKGIFLNNNQAVLINKSSGGKHPLTPAESVLAYKSALLSRERIITVQDIKTFCHYLLGDKLKIIVVKKGVAVHPGETQGYCKTIDIEIELHQKVYNEFLEKDDLSFWENYIQLLLEERSMLYLHYRVMIKNKLNYEER